MTLTLALDKEPCARCKKVFAINKLHQCVRCGEVDLCPDCETFHDCRDADERRIMQQADGA